MNSIDLNGQVAVVTGGAQGIGFAIAQRLVASGARVSLWDTNAAVLETAVEALGASSSSKVVDITDIDALRRVLKVTPINTIALRRDLADAAIRKGGYIL